MSAPEAMSMLERRRIEAQILKHVYDTLKASHGEDIARRTIADSVRRSSIEQGAALAQQAGGQTSLETFKAIQPLWTMEDALRVEVRKSDDKEFAFDVTRCRYAEMYRDMGLADIGHLLSCQRDGTFCEGYDKRLRLTRSQTIMQGASHCDFKYEYVDET